MKIGLTMKNKLGFIDDNITRPIDELLQSWIHTKSVLIFKKDINSRADLEYIKFPHVVLLAHVDSTLVEQSMTSMPTSKLYVMTFLVGQNEAFNSIGTQLLLMEPEATISMNISSIIQEIEQRAIPTS
ncbi:UBN2_3 domain-containing protein [Cucumis melo var. makuwa]|uniref:UBN2_3 domain-containing protein n=1 Tax=Cucumis melo var. makuwa TaxID=1194695 RepID=A0A5A7TXK1_CUCMM|nr:UBN2_3 domain-containing protein [Cucumis melo var. makuwa]TYK08005.1 UBN2_3 domain-containing protein [Cucumis melo var. makuwa]